MLPAASGTGAARLAPCQLLTTLMLQEPELSRVSGLFCAASCDQICTALIPVTSPVKTWTALALKLADATKRKAMVRLGPLMLHSLEKRLSSYSAWQGSCALAVGAERIRPRI